MNQKNSPVSLSLFFVAALCFLFPFVNFTCQGEKVASLTGIELAFGTSVQQQNMFGASAHKIIDAQPMATVSFSLAVTGFIWCTVLFLIKKRNLIVPSVFSILSFLSLVILYFNLNAKISANQEYQVLKSEYQSGYFLALLLLLANGAYGIFKIQQEKKLPHGSKSNVTVGLETKYCPECKTENQINNTYCIKCGSKLENKIGEENVLPKL